MRYIFDDRQQAHAPKTFIVNGSPAPSPEGPFRADCLMSALSESAHERVAAEEQDLGVLHEIHTPEYLTFLENIAERWAHQPNASEEVVPNVHPNGRRRGVGYPKSAAGQAGFHMADTACPISPETWSAVRAGAATAVQAADLVLSDGRPAYALCRPPGHHAFRDMAGGFCFLNNAAAAAQKLRKTLDRIAIVDVDVHHGNGTQDVFYERADVLTVSLHADPIRFYPFFWGYADETGDGEGDGFNLNLPLERGTGDDGFMAALESACGRLDAFGAQALVIALGLDAHESDPFQGLKITTGGFARIAKRLAQLRLPTVLVQEGGYMSDALGGNLISFLDGFENA